MKKLLISTGAILFIIGLTSGVTYALFSNKGEVKGVTMTTGNADLKIGATGLTGEGCITNDVSGQVCDSITDYGTISNMYPGYLVGDYFRLLNMSDSDIGLDVTATLSKYANSTNYPNSWGLLKNKVQARILEYASRDDAWWAFEKQNFNWNKVTKSTDWRNLEWWSNNSPQITSNSISPQSERHFVLWIRVVDSAGNEIVEKSIDLNIEFNGIQSI